MAKPSETSRGRVGLCAPDFDLHHCDDDSAWICIRPFLQAMLTEGAYSTFQGYDEKAVRLLDNTLRLKGKIKWRKETEPADGSGLVARFLGFFEKLIDGDNLFRRSLGEMLFHAVNVKEGTDALFEKVASDQGLSGYGFWALVGYGYTPILRI